MSTSVLSPNLYQAVGIGRDNPMISMVSVIKQADRVPKMISDNINQEFQKEMLLIQLLKLI